MKDIYKAAARVVVCLAQSPLAFFVHGLLHELLLQTSSPYFSSADLFPGYEWEEPLSMRWLALIEFLNLPWFSRIWIVQEIAMASQVRVQFAGWTYEWDSLVAALRPLISAHDMAAMLQVTQRGRKAVEHLHNLGRLSRIRTTMVMVEAHRTARRSEKMMRKLAGGARGREHAPEVGRPGAARLDRLGNRRSPARLLELLGGLPLLQLRRIPGPSVRAAWNDGGRSAAGVDAGSPCGLSRPARVSRRCEARAPGDRAWALSPQLRRHGLPRSRARSAILGTGLDQHTTRVAAHVLAVGRAGLRLRRIGGAEQDLLHQR